jgi:mannose-6-phosphate isomerase-like protein (cupin superfamily)
MKRMTVQRFVLFVVVLISALSIPAFAQFGGRHGDVVIFAVTANGSGDLLAVPLTTANTAQNLSNFRITSLNSVPFSSSEPFGLKRQVFYEQPNELFEMSTDDENSIGKHRIFLVPTKLFFTLGVINPLGNLNGNVNTFIAIPRGLDVTEDLALETIQFLTWAPTKWPFIAPTDVRGPVGPPELPGWLFLFLIPNAVKVPSLIPWTGLQALYPTGGWPEGIDSKLLEIDPGSGSTTRMLRLRPGKQTPSFRIPGHTHFYILQGGATITPVGGSTFTMKQNDYAFLPEGFTVTVANPQQFEGAGVR